jgi:hypothetical protein
VFLYGVVLASQDNVTVRFTGQQLNQEDLTLWEALVHLAKNQPLGHVCTFTAYDILKSMRSGDSGKEREILHKGIIRLNSCTVEVLINNSKVYFSSLIESGVKDEITGSYTIILSKGLIKLYNQNTWLDFEQRASLRRKPLSQFLHGYYSSHKSPYPVKVETLHRLSGSKSKNLSDFKQRIVNSLNDLVHIKFIASYCIVDNKVKVEK